MESEWLRLEHRGTSSCRRNKVREWFACEVPDEDENSGDDDWCHVADVFVDIQSDLITRIDVILTHSVDMIFDSEVEDGNFQKVIVAWLRTLCKNPFAAEVPLYCTRFKSEEDFVYFRDAHVLTP